ncbi:MAG: hypothetical protein JO325_09125, partial [Solirubrobacterales bacterium]|nr:hypothetical protein [Solirubrobacterales bacterium]
MSSTISAPAGDGVAEYPWERPLGAHPRADGLFEFRVWAPRAQSISLRLNGHEISLDDAGYGVYETTTPARPGDDYVFVLDGRELPDPCSRWQPDGIRGPSRVLEIASAPAPHRTAPMRDLVIYELHIGTFSDQGTFEAAIEHLAGLAELGINAIEIMPVAEYPWERPLGAHPRADGL